MDGVLCDFERQWARTAKMPFSKFQTLNINDRWKPVREHGSFWETIPWKGDGKMLWNYIKKHDVRILSAYSSSDPNCMAGKRKWLQKNVSISNAKIHLVTRSQKQIYSKKNTILKCSLNVTELDYFQSELTPGHIISTMFFLYLRQSNLKLELNYINR